MDREAEVMFDDISKNYEANFAHDAGLHETLKRVLSVLQPGSRILDVGCGTGKPVSFQMATAGHTVTGIDISQRMIDIAHRQVPEGKFEKIGMTAFKPESEFDAVFAIFSLFNLSREQISSMVTKFSNWISPGGLFVLGTIPSTKLFQDESLYDASGQWIDGKPMYFMGHDFHGSAATKKGWQELLNQAHFSIEEDISGIFSSPDQSAHKVDPEHQYYICRRRSE